ncbi:hypothetical protein PZ897_05075, partial [Hoeflea sp. YIM 152468]|uniref:hypothetical protein n=1 Tax=Hoeflea sp. YIM 152468 TaxID=3031759 RepID=UPI0023D99368
RVSGQLEDAFESLVVGITGDAEIFGYKPATLASFLVDAADNFRFAMALHRGSVTRGNLLNQLTGLDIDDHETFGRKVGNLSGEAQDSLLGKTPYPGLQLRGTAADGDIYNVHVAGGADREVFAIKKMWASHARRNLPTMVGAKRDRTGLESLWGEHWKSASQYLLSAAKQQPVLMKMALRNVVDKIKRAFHLEDNDAGGRNQKVISGIVEPLDWRLVNEVLNVIWPLENGQMHWSKMSHARQIIDQVIIYALGEEGAILRRKKLKRPGPKSKGPKKEDRGHLFAEYVFSTCLTYRHQLNTLQGCVEYMDARMFALGRVDNKSTGLVCRVNRQYAHIYYPLKDWMNEIRRRLKEGDYRPGDESVRRVTGDYLGYPDVPTVNKDLPQPQTTGRLIRALRIYEAKKVPVNKGVTGSPARPSKALTAEFMGPPTLAQLKKRNKIMMDRRKKGR